jgi:hypothetical protein
MPSKPCQPGCTCGRHAKRDPKSCLPGCTCYRHMPREFQPCGTYGAYQQHRLRKEPACEPCMEAQREYKRKHRNEYQMTPEVRRRRLESYRKFNTGLTDGDFDRIFASQERCCAICGSAEPGGRGTWAIDHDHACCSGRRSCGQCVRGVLCMNCNMALGLFHDDAGRLNAAADYILSRSVSSAPPSRGSTGTPGTGEL